MCKSANDSVQGSDVLQVVFGIYYLKNPLSVMIDAGCMLVTRSVFVNQCHMRLILQNMFDFRLILIRSLYSPEIFQYLVVF